MLVKILSDAVNAIDAIFICTPARSNIIAYGTYTQYRTHASSSYGNARPLHCILIAYSVHLAHTIATNCAANTHKIDFNSRQTDENE